MRHFIISGLVGLSVLGLVVLASCSDEEAAQSPLDGGSVDAQSDTGTLDSGAPMDASDAGTPDASIDAGPKNTMPELGGCPMFPADHIFNTPIAGLPPHPSSDAFMTTLGADTLHADFGPTVDASSPQYRGIPYNLVHGNAIAWSAVRYTSGDPEMNWDPLSESDCVTDATTHAVVSPCTVDADAGAGPFLPLPAAPLVEGGAVTDVNHQPYGPHHMVLLDQDTCHLWEAYHAYKTAPDGGWDIFGSAHFDVRSNALRPDLWTSADGAGFPILPLVLRAEEASSGEIHHALRFTVKSSHIRQSHTWPARHITWNGTMSATLPPMGQAFRIKAGYTIPDGFTTQAKAILQALKTYGMYIADGGTSWHLTGDPNASWEAATISQIESVSTSVFEAVDLSPIQARDGFNTNSAAVPPP